MTGTRKAPLWMCLGCQDVAEVPKVKPVWILGAARLLHAELALAHKLHLSPVSPVLDTSAFILSPQCPSLCRSLEHTNPFNFSSHSMLLSEYNAAPQPQKKITQKKPSLS